MASDGNRDLSTIILPPEDDIGRAVAEELRGQFGSSRRLIARCENLAAAQRGDRVRAIFAAANLLRASAHMANSVARVAKIETRHRSISEVSQPLRSPEDELNSKKREAQEKFEHNRKARRELEDKLQRMLDLEQYQAHLDFVASAAGIDAHLLSAEVPPPRYRSGSGDADDDEDDDEYDDDDEERG